MEHGARLSTSRVMAIAFIFMSVLIVLSLSVNVIQGVNNYRLQNEQRTAVTPMAFNAPFAVSQNSADASYLQQMALSFIALRLNVSSETCMTMEQANEKAKKLEQSSEAKPVAASLPRLAEGNFRTMPVQTVTATTPSGSRPAVTAHPEQKLLAPRPLFTAAREVKTVVPVSSVTPVTPPRPLRTGEQTAALWIAPYIDNQDVYHQPSSVFFVIKPSAWGKPRIN